MLNLVEIGRTVADIWQFFYFFQDGGRLPSWICCVGISTIHEGRLVVFIIVQNVV